MMISTLPWKRIDIELLPCECRVCQKTFWIGLIATSTVAADQASQNMNDFQVNASFYGNKFGLAPRVGTTNGDSVQTPSTKALSTNEEHLFTFPLLLLSVKSPGCIARGPLTSSDIVGLQSRDPTVNLT